MLTAIVLTKNESGNLPGCLRSLYFADSLIVLDDYSSDQTVFIAKKYHAQVYKHHLSGDFAAAHNYALSLVTSGWVLFVDADEVVPQTLAQEIYQATTQTKYHGFYIRRVDNLWGKTLFHGDSSPWLLRLGLREAGSWVGRVHETWQVTGRTARLRHFLLHYPHPTLTSFINHINFYSSLRAQELFDQGQKPAVWQPVIFPLGKFLYLYIFRLGFLDGLVGFISAGIMSFHSFLVRGKLFLATKHISVI